MAESDLDRGSGGMCPSCGADLKRPGAVEAAETHIVRGFVRFDADRGDFTDLPLYDELSFADIDGDEVVSASHRCRKCMEELSSYALGGF